MANEEEIARLVIRLVADVKDVKTQLASVQGTVKGTTDAVEKSAQGFSASIAGIRATYIEAAAAIYGAYKTIQGAVNLLEIGARAKQTEEAFAALTTSMGVNGEELIRQMKETGQVFVDETDLMIKAQRLLVEKVSAADIVKLMDSSRVAAKLMGTDVSEAFDRVSEAVITLRTRGLKAAFSMDETKIFKDFADKAGIAAENLTDVGKRLALVNEINRQGIEKKSFLGSVLDPNTKDQMEKVGSAFDELKESIGKALLEGAKESNLFPAILDLIKVLRDAVKSAEEMSTAYSSLFDALDVGFKTFGISVSAVLTGTTTVFAGLYEINYELLSMVNFLTLGAFPGLKKALQDFDKERLKVFASLTSQANSLQDQMFGRPRAPEPKPAAKPLGGKGLTDADIKDQQRIKDAVTKFLLANEAERIAAQNEMIKSGIERQRVMEIDGAQTTGQSVALINMKWDRVALEDDLRASKEAIAIKEAGEVKAAEIAHMNVAVVNNKFNAQRLAAEAKYRAGIAKVDADYDAYERKMRSESLASDEERLNLRNQIVASKLDAQRTIALEAARREGKDVAAEEIRWDGVIAAETLRATQEDLAAREKIDLDAAREKGQSLLDVEIHYIQLRQDAEAKYNADVTKGEAAAAEHRRELAAQSATDWASWNQQIAEATGNYDSLTNAQVQALQAEEDNYVASKRWGELELEEQVQYLAMMELRKAKLEEVRELEKANFISDYQTQLAGLTGDWNAVNDAQIKAIESQRAYLLATAGTNQEMKDLVNQVANLKIAQAQARDEWNFAATNQVSVQQESVKLTGQIADAYGTAVVSSVNAAGDALGNFLNNLKSVSEGTMSLGDAFTKLGQDFASAVQKMIIEVLVLIAKMYILKALQAGSGLAGGGEVGGSTWESVAANYQTGGSIHGPAGRDAVPIRATAGEYMQPVPAVRYYGLQAMEAIRQQKVPRELFAGLHSLRTSRPNLALDAGGSVPRVSTSEGSQKGKDNITVINVTDVRELDKYLSSSAGQGAVVNVISSRAEAVKKILR